MVLDLFCVPGYTDLFGVLRHFQHCTGHITTGSWKGRGNQYIQFIRVLHCKLPTNDKQLPAFPLEAMPGTEPRPQRWEARVLPLCHRGPLVLLKSGDCSGAVASRNPLGNMAIKHYESQIRMSLVLVPLSLTQGSTVVFRGRGAQQNYI